ncbi:MAG: hypothetical protein V1708_00710 [Candidatus Micrarchaeota archaeon]
MALFSKRGLAGFVIGLLVYLPLLWLLAFFFRALSIPLVYYYMLPELPFLLAYIVFKVRPGIRLSHKAMYAGFFLAFLLGLGYILYARAVALNAAK